jgi:hypothetical protein
MVSEIFSMLVGRAWQKTRHHEGQEAEYNKNRKESEGLIPT